MRKFFLVGLFLAFAARSFADEANIKMPPKPPTTRPVTSVVPMKPIPPVFKQTKIEKNEPQPKLMPPISSLAMPKKPEIKFPPIPMLAKAKPKPSAKTVITPVKAKKPEPRASTQPSSPKATPPSAVEIRIDSFFRDIKHFGPFAEHADMIGVHPGDRILLAAHAYVKGSYGSPLNLDPHLIWKVEVLGADLPNKDEYQDDFFDPRDDNSNPKIGFEKAQLDDFGPYALDEEDERPPVQLVYQVPREMKNDIQLSIFDSGGVVRLDSIVLHNSDLDPADLLRDPRIYYREEYDFKRYVWIDGQLLVVPDSEEYNNNYSLPSDWLWNRH